MRSLFVVLTTLALAGAAVAGTPECDPELTVQAPNGTYYSIDNDLCQPECLFSIWVYGDDDPEPCDPDDDSGTIIL